jgi:hypothetical protein
MRSEAGWSFVSPDPIVLHTKKFNELIVYWHGLAMIHETSCVLVCHSLAGLYPGQGVKLSIYNKFIKLYNTGIFQTQSWDGVANVGASAHYDYLKHYLETKKAFSNITLKETLEKLTDPQVIIHVD